MIIIWIPINSDDDNDANPIPSRQMSQRLRFQCNFVMFLIKFDQFQCNFDLLIKIRSKRSIKRSKLSIKRLKKIKIN